MLPPTADVVVIGGGVMGASAAYHLAAAGVKNVVLLEKARIPGHGGHRQMRRRHPLPVQHRDQRASVAAQPADAGTVRGGDRAEHRPALARLPVPAGQRARPGGLPAERGAAELAGRPLVHPLARAKSPTRVPLLNLEGVMAGAWHAGDGLADPNGVVQGYAAAARRLGASDLHRDRGHGISCRGRQGDRGRARRKGDISTPAVVNAAGPWAGKVAALAGVDLPIVPLRRQIVVTDAAQGRPRRFPVRARLQPLALLPPRGQGHPDRPVEPQREAGLRPVDRPRVDRAAPGERHVALPAAGEGRPAARVGRAVRGDARRAPGDRQASPIRRASRSSPGSADTASCTAPSPAC